MSSTHWSCLSRCKQQLLTHNVLIKPHYKIWHNWKCRETYLCLMVDEQKFFCRYYNQSWICLINVNDMTKELVGFISLLNYSLILSTRSALPLCLLWRHEDFLLLNVTFHLSIWIIVSSMTTTLFSSGKLRKPNKTIQTLKILNMQSFVSQQRNFICLLSLKWTVRTLK